MSSRCQVCNLETAKTGRHYGAITCYPCRAFFRRAQTRKRELRCKNNGKCRLDGNVKKFCPCCRYGKCISIGMKPEYVLDEEGISQRFKYAKARPRPLSESGDLEISASSDQEQVLDFRRMRASSSSEQRAPSPLTSPNATEGHISPAGQEPVLDFRRSSIAEEVASLSPGPGSVRASPSPGTSSGLPGRGWFSPLSGPPVNSLEVSSGGLWPLHPSPRGSFHSESSASPRPDWFTSSQNQTRSNFLRGGVSPECTNWFPAPETIIKEEVDPVPPIRVSVIRSNPNKNDPIKIETPAPGSRIIVGREQENFVLPAPTPIIQHSFYPPYNVHSSREYCHDSSSDGGGLPTTEDLSSISFTRRTHETFIKMMKDRQIENQKDTMRYLPEESDQPKPEHRLEFNIENEIEESRFEEEAEGGVTNYDNEMVGHYLKRYEYRHKKYRARRIENSNCEDEGMEDNAEDAGNVVSAVIPSNNYIDMDVEMDSPSSISSLLFQNGIFDTQELDNMFIDDMEKVFFKAWRQLNLGEDVMKAYIDFCTHRGELDPQFFSCANMQFRKKFLNFITDYDVINLPTKKLYNAIRKNLATAQSLIYVFQFNQPCWEQELRLGSGDQDWEQWQNRPDRNLRGLQFSEMMHHIKLPDSSKMELLRCLLQMCLPIMQDTKVFILTFLLGLFKNETDQEVVRLREMFESILVKYLLYNFKKFSKMNQMNNVKMIVDQLEILSKMVK